MSRKVWVPVFLAVTALALGGELWAGLDNSDKTVPWTDLIVHYIPWPVTALAIAVLVTWLPIHFYRRYRRKEDAMHEPAQPAKQLVDPEDNRTDPMIPRALLTMAAGAIVDLAMSFGLHLTAKQQGSLSALLFVLLVAGYTWWARKHVFSPATVNKLLAAARIRRQ